MKHSTLTGMVAALVLVGGPALSHHSFAMFDMKKSMTVTGSVREFQWTNPHAWIQVVGMDPATNVTGEWGVEMGSPTALVRNGWKRTTLKPGDRVTVVMHPMHDGSKAGSFVTVTLSDGTVMGDTALGGPPNPVGPPAAPPALPAPPAP